MDVMSQNFCKSLVFSSSAAVYGQPASVPCTELDHPLHVTDPYGHSKLKNKDIMHNVHHLDPEWKIVLLRYFKPMGSHPNGGVGEDHAGYPNSLIPFVQQVAVGSKETLCVWNNYNTFDGTGVRDYVHVMDLASGHIKALDKLFATPDIGRAVSNLGTGRGTMVFEMVAAFGKACGKKTPLQLADRRPGDSSEGLCRNREAEKELGW